MKSLRASLRVSSLLCLLAVAPAARAGEDRFALTIGVPSDCFLMVAGANNPEQEFLRKAWDEVFDTVKQSGVMEDVWGLITGAMSADQQQAASQASMKIKSLCDGMDWNALFDGQALFCMRLKVTGMEGGGMMFPEVVFLSQGSGDSAKKNFGGLKAIFKEMGAHAGEHMKLSESKHGDASVVALKVVESGAPPLGIAVALHKDVIALSMGVGILEESLDLLAGASSKKSLSQTGRFKKAFDGLPPAEDSLVFVDVRRVMDTTGGAMNGFSKQLLAAAQQADGAAGDKGATPQEEGDDHGSSGGDGKAGDGMRKGAGWLGLCAKLTEDLSVVDFVAATGHTDGMRVFTDSRAVLRSDAKSRAGYAIMTSGGKIEPFDRYIPQETISFRVTSGVSPNAAYQWLVGLVREDAPDGEMLLGMWNGIQQRVGINLEKDLFSWIEGPVTSIEMKSNNPMMPTDSVTLIKVRDEKRCQERIETGLDRLGKMIGGMGGPMGGGRGKKGDEGDQPIIVSTPVKIAGRGGFFQVSFQHPMLMMLAAQFHPVWGVADGYLWIGTSKKAIGTCLETASGEHAGIRKSKRFTEEALMPSSGEGDLLQISYTDTTHTAETLSQVLASLGMIGMFTGMNPELGKSGAGKILAVLPGIAAKLGPAVEKLNFFLSSARCATFDGKQWRSRMVDNYREPPRAGAEAGGKKDDDWDDDWGEDKDPSGAKGEKPARDDAPKSRPKQ